VEVLHKVHAQSNKQARLYQFSHYDREHKKYCKAKKAEGNLAQVEDDLSEMIPLGSPVVTTTEPNGDVADEDEMMFTGEWCTPVGHAKVDGDEGVTPAAY
jgi:hypothetical protein